MVSLSLQATSGWRPDFLSLLIGLVAGSLLAVAVYRLLPTLRAWRDRAVSRFQETQAWVRTGIEIRFQVETDEYVKKVHLGGTQVALDRIYVEPRLLAPQTDLDLDVPHEQGASQLHYLWPETTLGTALPPVPSVTVRQLLLHGRRVVLSAGPGHGKTTLLAYCAHLCADASDMGPYTFLLPVVPLLVHLAELELALEKTSGMQPDNEANPIAPLLTALQRRLSPITARGLGDLLRQKFASGQVLLLLDGWDELSAEDRSPAAGWLARLLAVYPSSQVIMAGPLRGYGPLRELGFVVSGLLPWRQGQAERYGQLWAAANGLEGIPPVHSYWRPGQPALETFLRLQLALASSNLERDEQPQRQVELLERNLLRLLPQPDDAMDPPWLAPATRELWQQAAYRLLSDRALCLARRDLLSTAVSILADFDVQETRSASQRLVDVTASSALFVSWPERGLGLLSPTWRDYLAAGHLTQWQLSQEAMDQAQDPMWQDALRFYAGRSGGDGLAKRLLDLRMQDDLAENLFQLATWLPESLDKREWRRNTLIRLGQMVVKANLPVPLRQRAALALAHTRESGVLALLRQLLSQPDPSMRQAAVAALAGLGVEVALDPIQQMLNDADEQVRQAAVHAMVWLSDPSAEKAILTALIEQDEARGRAAAEGLALSGTDDAHTILREALAEEALHTRRAAVFGLALLDQHWSVELLDEVERNDAQWLVRSAASSALEEIVARNKPGAWTLTPASDLEWLIQWAASEGRAVPGGEAAMGVLQEALTAARDTGVRTKAALTLGRMAAREATDVLQTALRDPKPELRQAAFTALCQISRAWDVPVIGRSEPE